MGCVKSSSFVFLAVVIVGCGDSSGSGGAGGASTVPSTYSFEREGATSVAYTGQTTRQTLVSDVIDLMRTISAEVLGGNNLAAYDTADDVNALFLALYEEGGLADTNRDLPNLVQDGDTMLQQVYGDLNGANLKDKLAGNDDVTDHRDWDGDMDDDDDATNQTPAFVGWDASNLIVDDAGNNGPVATPEELLLALFWTFSHQVSRAAATSDFPIDAETPLYLTPEGLDLVQLTQKFLLGAVNFSQGVDDYLDDDVDDKGLRADNTELASEANYTALEHFFDEAYGYWGAARDYSAYTDEEIAARGGRADYENGYFDTNADGSIDLESEYNFSASVNAAKRDLGSDPSSPTDFTAEADLAWRTGRMLITSAYETGTPLDTDALAAARDTIALTWEKAIAATAIHYVNDVLGDMSAIDEDSYSFADHAKHWGELKGFALSFQFNPDSPMEADFAELHALIGDTPVGASPTNPVNDTGYREALLAARALMGDAYDFDEANVLAW